MHEYFVVHAFLLAVVGNGLNGIYMYILPAVESFNCSLQNNNQNSTMTLQGDQ